jgi:hypothetical protein
MDNLVIGILIVVAIAAVVWLGLKKDKQISTVVTEAKAAVDDVKNSRGGQNK